MHSIRTVAACGLVAGLVSLGSGAPPTATTIPLGAAHGDTITNVAGAAVPLTNTSFLVSTHGPDNEATTADDETLLISDATGAPVITALATPFMTSYSPRTCRVSATRALISHAGPDATFETADDGVYLLDKLGTLNTVTSLTTGGIWTGDGMTPTALSANVAVVCTVGPDGDADTDDDTVALLEDLGAGNTVTHLPAESVRLLGQYQPVRLTDTSFLVTSSGPDGSGSNADDTIYLFTDVGGANTRVDLATPNRSGRASGRSVPLSPTRALVVTDGPDNAIGNDDDVVFLLDDLGTGNTVTPITVPGLFQKGAGLAIALTDTTAVVATEGPDGDEGTADDVLALLSDLGGANTVTPITVGRILEDFACRPVRLTATSVAFCTAGADGTMNTGDDEVVVVSDLGGANTVGRIAVPGLSEGSPSRIVRLAADDVLLTTGGQDGAFGTGDDEVVTRISDLLGTPVVESTPVGSFDDEFHFSVSPHLLGAGRAAMAHTGADGAIGSGLDDGVTLLSGLPGGGSLTTTSLKFSFPKNKPEKPEKIKLKGTLMMDDPDAFGSGDLTVAVGNARQVIPAAALTFDAKKGLYKYKDKKNAAGFVKSLTFKVAKNKLTIVGKAAGRPDADAIEVSVQTDDVWFAETFAGEAKNKVVKYKAPK